ncbi:MAG: TIGR02391 family protein [Thermoplasmata archaeon]|nr:TIGR02391 family protein [Thermoplasmata archaeon]
MSNKKNTLLAGIQYLGLPGTSQPCQDAILQLLQFNVKIGKTRILSNDNEHCLLLTVDTYNLIAVKSGFASGYKGEGPRTLSYVLQLLDAHGSEIEEYKVEKDMISRLDSSSLTQSDIDNLDNGHPIRPNRWYDYVYDEHWELRKKGTLWKEFHPVIPFAIVDNRIVDLALSFWENPDEKLLTGYRRLEDIVRERTSIDEHGSKLFSNAFIDGPLIWKNLNQGEQKGRANLFTSVYMAYRNPRAHQEFNHHSNDLLAEFLLLNHLYSLEKKSIKCENEKTS